MLDIKISSIHIKQQQHEILNEPLRKMGMSEEQIKKSLNPKPSVNFYRFIVQK